MVKPLNEQVVVIIGASSGIGRAAALKFAQAGATVVLGARGDTALRSVADEIIQAGGKAHVVPVDVSDWNQVQNLAQETVNNFGRIDTWVNDAAIAVYATFDQTTVEEMDRIIQVNLLGQMYGVKAVLPYMKAQQSGTIINIGSVESIRAMPYHSIYAASKHGVKGFTEALRMELKREKNNINVTLIMPASINTPFFGHARSKLGAHPRPVPPVYSPELVADAIVEAATHRRRHIAVGGPNLLLKAMESISPAFTDRLLGAGGSLFKLQKANKPDDMRDNLFAPLNEDGRVHGDFDHLVKPSIYTRMFQVRPRWGRLLLPAVAIGAFSFFRSRE